MTSSDDDLQALQTEVQQEKSELDHQTERVAELSDQLQRENKSCQFLLHVSEIHTCQLEEETSLLQRELHHLDRLRFTHEQQCERAQECNEARELCLNCIATLEMNSLRLRCRINAKKEEVADLQTENDNLAQLLNVELLKVKSFPATFNQEEQQAQQLQAEVDELHDCIDEDNKFNLAELECMRQTIRCLYKEAHNLKKSNHDLGGKLKLEKKRTVVNEIKVAKVMLKLEEETERHKVLIEQKSQLSDKISGEADRIAELKDQLGEIDDVHRQELEAVEQDQEGLHRELEKLKTTNTALTTRIKAAEEQNRNLQTLMNQLSNRAEEETKKDGAASFVQEKQSCSAGLSDALRREHQAHQHRVQALSHELASLGDMNRENVLKLRDVEAQVQTLLGEAVGLEEEEQQPGGSEDKQPPLTLLDQLQHPEEEEQEEERVTWRKRWWAFLKRLRGHRPDST